MKKLLLLFAVVTALLSFKILTNHNAASVNILSGVNVFHDCTPADNYKELGSFTVGICVACDYSGVKEKAVKLAKEKFPSCDGVLLSGKTGERVIAVKFD